MLARRRDPRALPQARLGRGWFQLADRLKLALGAPAFERLLEFGGEASSYELEIGTVASTDFDVLEGAGIVEQRRGIRATTTFRFASARWREFFASLDLRLRATRDGAHGLGATARPSWLNVWRFAATLEGGAVLEAAQELSPVLGLLVRAACNQSASGGRLAALGRRTQEVLVAMLRDTSTQGATTALIALSRDPDAGVREAAAGALQGTGDREALGALVTLSRDPDAGVRGAAARALQGTGNREAGAALIALSRDADADVRVRGAVARALRGTGDPEALAALVVLLCDATAPVSVRRAAARALRGTGDRAALAALIPLLGEADLNVRVTAAGALEGTSDPEALTALIPLLGDADPIVRVTAAKALRAAPPRSTVAQLALAERRERGRTLEIDEIIQGRLLADDVPFSAWPAPL